MILIIMILIIVRCRCCVVLICRHRRLVIIVNIASSASNILVVLFVVIILVTILIIAFTLNVFIVGGHVIQKSIRRGQCRLCHHCGFQRRLFDFFREGFHNLYIYEEGGIDSSSFY